MDDKRIEKIQAMEESEMLQFLKTELQKIANIETPDPEKYVLRADGLACHALTVYEIWTDV